MLKFNNITIYDNKQKITNLNLHIQPGEISILKYDSSEEKDLLISLICQIISPKSGEIFIHGNNLTKINKKSNFSNFGISYEDFKLIQSKTVINNVIFPLENFTTLPKEDILHGGENLLKAFGLFNKRNFSVAKLTLEEKQRLNIARALITDPDLLILDNFDKHIQEDKLNNLLNYFIDLNKMGKTILIISNNKFVNQKLYCKTYLLKKGAITNV